MYITQISYTIFLTTHIRGNCRLDDRLLLIEINKKFTTDRTSRCLQCIGGEATNIKYRPSILIKI